MVALPPVPNVVRVNISGTYGSAKWLNGLYLQYAGGPPNDADLLTLAGAIRTSWLATVATTMSAEVSASQFQCIDLNSDTGKTAANGTVATGTLAATDLPANVAACVSFRQDRRYRGGHPRNYVLGMLNANLLNSQQFTTAYCTALTTAYTTMRTTLNALTYATMTSLTWVAVQRYEVLTPGAPATPRAAPIVRPVASFTVNQRVDSQRRRLGR